MAGGGNGVPSPEVGGGSKVSGAARKFGSFLTDAGEAGKNITGTFRSVADGMSGGLRAAGPYLGKAAKFMGDFGAPLAYIDASHQGFNTDTEQYAKRFGLENTEPGLLRDMSVRALGVVSDAGNALAFGAPKDLGWYRDVSGDPNSAVTKAARIARPGFINEDNMGGGAQPTSPPPQLTPTVASYSNEGRNYPQGQLRDQFPGQTKSRVQMEQDLQNSMSNASVLARNPAGAVTKTIGPDGKVSYSGGIVRGDVAMVDKDGRPLPGQPGGGFISGSGDGTFRMATDKQIANYHESNRQAQMANQLRALNGPVFNAGEQEAFKTQLRDLDLAISGARHNPLVQAELIKQKNTMLAGQATEATSRQRANNELRKGIIDSFNTADSARHTADQHYNAQTDVERIKIQGAKDALRMKQMRMQGYAQQAGGGNGKEPDLAAMRAAAAFNNDEDALKQIDALIEGAQKQTASQGGITDAQRKRLADKIVYPVFDKEGKETGARDAAREARALQHILAQRKDLAELPDPELNRVMPQVLGEWGFLEKLNAAKADQKGLTIAGWSPHSNGSVPITSTMPDLRNTTLGKSRGIGDGWGIGTGDYYIEGLNNGNGMHNVGPLTAEEVAAAQRAQGLR